jgi:hypothetical protein
MKKGICATKGREDIIAKRYKEISDIVKKNSSEKVEKVIKSIADISRSAWYKCISKGPRRGLVSNSVISKFAKFSGLSEDIFSGKIDFTAEDKKILADKVKEVFGKDKKIKTDKKEMKDKTKRKYNKKVKKDDKKVDKIGSAEKSSSPVKVKRQYKKRIKKDDGFKSAVELAEMSNEIAEKSAKSFKMPVETVKEKRPYNKSVKTENGLSVNKLKEFASEIESLKDIKQLESISEILEKLSKITEKKIDFVSALEEL